MTRKWVPYVIFVAIMLAVGFAASMVSTPDEWYAGLEKAWFNPPNWVFAPVWTLLYILIGIAGGVVYNWNPQSLALKLWWVQLFLNGIWSPVFFYFHQPLLALFILAALLGTIIRFIGKTWQGARTAAWLFVPYFLWVFFATMLNASIVALN